MKTVKLSVVMLLSLILALSMSSCAFFSSEVNRFGGGELLDADMIESIKQEIFPSGDPSVNGDSTNNPSQEIIDVRDTVTDVDTVTETPEDTTAIESSSDITESVTYDKESTEVSVEESLTEADSSVITDESGERITVYWSKGGSVWHLSLKCYHVAKLDTVYSGYVEDAIAAKKEKLCSYCEKHYKD